jgi:hypothetical protein
MKVFIGTMSKVQTEPKSRFVPVIPSVAIIPRIEPAPISLEPIDTIVVAEVEPIVTHVEPIQAEALPSIPKKAEQVPLKKEDRKVRSVSFNLTDPAEIRMNKFADKKSSFSTYVKGLIQRDMEASK